MKKLMTADGFLEQLIAFVILQPFLDIYRTFIENRVEIMGIALQEWINILFFGYLCILFLITNIKKPKVYIPLLVYAALIAVYLVLHSFNILQFDSSILGNSEISIFKEIYMIARVYLIPVVIFYMFLCSDLSFEKFQKAVNVLSAIISINIVVTNLLKVSFICYASTLEKNTFISRNIIEWFTNPDTVNPAFMTSKGWFYIGNQIGIILFMLYPMVIMNTLKTRKLKNYILFAFHGVAMCMVGTRVANLGGLLSLFVALAIAVVFGMILKQFKFKFKDLAVMLCITASIAGLFMYSPMQAVQHTKEEAYVVDEAAQKMREEIIKRQEGELEDDDGDGNSGKLTPKEFAAEIEKTPYAYGIEKEFIELFSIEDNYEFWYDVITRGDNTQVNYRSFKMRIFEEVIKKNDNKLDRWLGIGYTTNFPYVEKDFISQNVWYGYIGTALFIGPYILMILAAVIYAFINIKKHMVYQNAFFAVSIGGTLLLSMVAGHLFYGVFSITIFAFIVAAFCKYQKEVSDKL